jgi:hypothetical protein
MDEVSRVPRRMGYGSRFSRNQVRRGGRVDEVNQPGFRDGLFGSRTLQRPKKHGFHRRARERRGAKLRARIETRPGRGDLIFDAYSPGLIVDKRQFRLWWRQLVVA